NSPKYLGGGGAEGPPPPLPLLFRRHWYGRTLSDIELCRLLCLLLGVSSVAKNKPPGQLQTKLTICQRHSGGVRSDYYQRGRGWGGSLPDRFKIFQSLNHLP
ncbi:unnamed protein product, partial [Ixodes hexagonus]